MNALLPLILLASGPVQAEAPQSYLVSIVDIPLKAGESLESFTVSTWGATFSAVCHIPPGWAIRAGGGLTPEGVLEGEGSHGAAWFREGSPVPLQAFALVTLQGPVRTEPAKSADGGGDVPATFKGSATISTGDEDRQVALTARNVRLTSAARCPDRSAP